MDTLDRLEALNPAPEFRGNPGPLANDTPPRRDSRRGLAAVLTVAAIVIVLGAIFINRADRPIEVDVAGDVAQQPAAQTEEPPGTSVAPTPAPQPTVGLAVVPVEGDPVARLVIPEIDLDVIVVHGTNLQSLRKGPGHYPGTPLPGQAGNAAIAGLRTTYGALFYKLDQLEPDDAIFVTTPQGVFEYRVRGSKLVEPDALEVLEDTGENLLTLTTDDPPFAGQKWLVVVADLVGDPVASISIEDLLAQDAAPRPQVTFDRSNEAPLPTVDPETSPYLAYRGTDDPAATAWGFVVSQFPGWNGVELGEAVAEGEFTFIRWHNSIGFGTGWIVLQFGDGRYWVREMTTDGFEFVLDSASTGARGTVIARSRARIEVTAPRDFDLAAVGTPRSNPLDFAPQLIVAQIGLGAVGEREPLHIPFPANDNFQAVRMVLTDENGIQFGAVATGLNQRWHDTFTQVAVAVDKVAELESLIDAHPLIVFDWFTLDRWQSADPFAYIAPEFATDRTDQVPTMQLVSLLFYPAVTSEDAEREQGFLDAVAAIGTVLEPPEDPTALREEDADLGEPAERYVVEELPSVARCGAAGVREVAAQVERPDDQIPRPTASEAAGQVPWQLRGDVIEFVNDAGSTLGFANAITGRPRSFLAVVSVSETAQGWIVDQWETVGC